ncbi:adenylate/guanylate cyclase domain-containing protein [Azospirillum sp. TSO22-1]|uniref:adenylate/guanylate cyclase domain-containing protein n=1 Tax=Azospirillum sp. TSO22-1 TaxID=716789 RepID=UPI000D60F24C|nr:adenylate/guanylate cyclase domain-containing protein [Azospirillum sp. TSO22-1]PWC44925.1 guanylate cyclase [Azospirillum sp. TSO22-1]
MAPVRLLAAALAVGALAVGAAWAALPLLEGPSLDTLYVAREMLYGPRPAPDPNRVAIVALDEETYRRPPFAGTPQVLWTPYLGKVLTAIDAVGVAAIGMDLVYPTSAEAAIPGFERDFLLALRNVGRAGRLVLAKVQHSTQPLLPHRGHALAVGGAPNIRSVNLVEDADGVLRRVPLTLATTAGEEPGLAAELVKRADGTVPPGRSLLVNHPTAAGSFPVHSLADLAACADPAYFERHFRGKVVLVGTALDVEDRKLTSNRWVTKPEGQNLPPRCALPVMEDLAGTGRRRDTVPGVTIHAAAVSNMLTGTTLTESSPGLTLGVLALAAALSAGLTLALSPLWAALGLGAVLATWGGGAAMAFQGGLVLPLVPAALVAVLVFPALVAFRFMVVDRDRRYVRNAFRLYLPGSVVDSMVASGRMPQLGGEERPVTVLFSDIAGYTKMSEGLEPEALVRLLNRYFTVMTDIVEKHGGFVDKYIGDAILAVFGAPMAGDNHARAAVDAALEMQAALASDPTLLSSGNGQRGAARIGLATGPALMGNIGSPRRFNYTVMGDTVNLASRLEGANKAFGTGILVADATADLYGDAQAFRAIDTIQVVGRDHPVTILEPLSPARRDDPADTGRRAAYAEALEHWRAGRFAEAASAFAALAYDDKAAAVMHKRAAQHAAEPVLHGWTGVTALTEK